MIQGRTETFICESDGGIHIALAILEAKLQMVEGSVAKQEPVLATVFEASAWKR